MATFDTQKSELESRKKSLSPNPYENPLFAKNGVQIGQLLPLWAHFHFTPGYRGSPPCTLSQHPDNRETGYSNVLRAAIKPTDCVIVENFTKSIPEPNINVDL